MPEPTQEELRKQNIELRAEIEMLRRRLPALPHVVQVIAEQFDSVPLDGELDA